jgi:hypothetical protein
MILAPYGKAVHLLSLLDENDRKRRNYPVFIENCVNSRNYCCLDTKSTYINGSKHHPTPS